MDRPSSGAPAPGATNAGHARPTRAPIDPLRGPAGETLPADVARTLRGFFADGRLTSIPARDRKRRVVLGYLRDRVFTEDRAYPEAEVNQRLALFHRDVAALRRSMVDAGLVTRAGGEYRRVISDGVATEG